MKQTRIIGEDDNIQGLEIKHYKVGQIYTKQVKMCMGMVLKGHEHNYDHLSILASGSVAVTVDGATRVYMGPAAVGIKANKMHEITALSDALWYCVHAAPEEMPVNDVDSWLVS